MQNLIFQRYAHKLKTRIDSKNRTPLETVIPLSVPFVIFVDPSDRCNFQCKFCPTGDRELMKRTPGRNFGNMDFELYKKIVDDICEFERPIKVLRLYKDGEPLLNPRFADMIRLAKDKGCAERVDTTTNASLLTKKKAKEIIEAGIDRINISIEGMTEDQYLKFSGFAINYDNFLDNIRYLYENKGNCEIIIKINGDVISQADVEKFYELFGDIADGIFVEHVMSCWPEFELRGGLEVNKEKGIYGQEITYVSVCPYVFYSFSINSDGTASACFLDWARKLLIGDVRVQKVKDIWHCKEMREYQKLFLRHERKKHPFCKDCGQLTHGMPDNIDEFAEELLKKIKEPTG